MTPTNQDIIDITILISQGIVELSVDFYNALIYGSDSKDCLRDKIFVLSKLNELICEYDPSLEESSQNCISQIELETILYYIRCTYSIYFPQFTGDNSIITV